MEAVSKAPDLSPRDPSRGMQVWKAAVSEVGAVLRLAFTLRVDRSRIVGLDQTIVLLAAAALAVWLGIGWLRFDTPMRLDSSGLPGVAAFACAALALAWMLSRVGSPPVPLRLTMWLVTGYLPAAAAAFWVLGALSGGRFAAVAVLCAVHAALYFFFGLRGLATGQPWRPFATWVAAVAALLVLGQTTELRGGLWTPHRSQEQVARYQESVQRAETLLYAQGERISAALGSLTDPQPGPHVYFVGFAGFGEQRVFAQEIALAEQRVRERYATDGRSLVLVNDQRDLDRHPLASRSALARVLSGVAARMDRDDDVLFLALSSHGKRDPYLVVTNGALPFDKLTPDSLAEILDASGITWKVLVISACYSGAFIDRLRDDHTAIITAAAPGKTSFGCNDRRELTYFGEAFYRDALPRAASLPAAFEIAAADIARRERREHLEPSEPRAYFGAAIARKLAEVERMRR
jgi:hypothetical protein